MFAEMLTIGAHRLSILSEFVDQLWENWSLTTYPFFYLKSVLSGRDTTYASHERKLSDDDDCG